MKTSVLSLFYCLFLFSVIQAQSIEFVDQGGGINPSQPTGICLTDADRDIALSTVKKTIQQLKKEGKYSTAAEKLMVEFDWPLRVSDELNYTNVHGISNFVDQNEFSGIEDFNCGSRSYDGHRGTDYFTWPFPWYLYDNDYVEVVTAAAGTIVEKLDGEEDDHCACEGDWNAVYVAHSDGSLALYGHLKKNTLTNKSIGDSVAKGEYLGVVASSGCSTGPHLHFEVYDLVGNLIDPYKGSCNSLNADSWWSDQIDYYDPAINTILTHSKEPVHGCPGVEEEPYLENDFLPGDIVYTAFYYHDQQMNHQSSFRLLDPNGTTWTSWNHSAPDSYNASWWWWSWNLPSSGPYGVWTVEAEYQGKSYTHSFNYGIFTSTEEPEKAGDISLWPNPANEEVYLESTEPLEELNIYDSTGRLLKTIGSPKNHLSVADYTNGIYFIAIRTEAGVTVKKMVKQ